MRTITYLVDLLALAKELLHGLGYGGLLGNHEGDRLLVLPHADFTYNLQLQYFEFYSNQTPKF